jgi:hypothetical protein
VKGFHWLLAVAGLFAVMAWWCFECRDAGCTGPGS